MNKINSYNIFSIPYAWAVYSIAGVFIIFTGRLLNLVPTFSSGDFPTPLQEQFLTYLRSIPENITITASAFLFLVTFVQVMYNTWALLIRKQPINKKKIIINASLFLFLILFSFLTYSSLFVLAI